MWGLVLVNAIGFILKEPSKEAIEVGQRASLATCQAFRHHWGLFMDQHPCTGKYGDGSLRVVHTLPVV